jgi:peptide deformylase
MIIIDAELLKKPCENVSLFEAGAIIEQLDYELKHSKSSGIGLAANQIGILKRVCILRVGNTSIDFINPIITQQYDLSEFDHEGCLSFPGIYILTKRYNEIVVKDSLHPAGIILVGLEAVVAQHEIGHLNGELMYQYEIKRPAVNEPCWCNETGGKKYKRCHLGKAIK